MGVEPGTIGIAVLIQPWIRFDARGTAVVHDGGVRVETLHPTETPHTAGPGEAHSNAVAEIARSALRATGESVIEWGRAADPLVLLQVRTAPAAPGAGARGSARRPERSFPPIAERLAELAASFPGPLGDAWVLPWAATLEAAPAAPPIEVEDPAAGVAVAGDLAAELSARAWGDPAAAAVAIRAALGPSPDPALGRLARLRPVDGAAAARLVGLVGGVERALRRRGALGAMESVWRLTPHELARAAGGDGAARPRRFGPDRWEPFVHAVVSGNGRRLAGDGAAAGVGAGRLRILRGPEARWAPRPREILVAPEALAQVAPWLWNAAGLVTSNGTPGAHLFEVARSLGVPAVVGTDVPGDADGRLAAVDGDAGTLSILEPAAPARRWA
jgi:phosphohistidine swiveling domain-containing protein